MDRQRGQRNSRPHWAEPPPPYHLIEMKIGEELRERYQPPKELPHMMFTLLRALDEAE